LTLENY